MLAKRSVDKKDTSNIITLGVIAKKCKDEDPMVINSTIGMLYDENSKLFVFKSVEKAINSLKDEEKFAYSATEGTSAYKDALKRWVFKNHYEDFKDKTDVISTPGGSGALSNSFANYLNPGEKALLPSYMWVNYTQMLYEYGLGYETYELFDKDGHFNLESLKEKANILKQTQENIVILLNDPCQNPTGYSLTPDELKNLVKFINELAEEGTNVIFIHDLAYIDYNTDSIYQQRDNLALYKDMNDNVLVILAFSGSKAFGLYGLRIGAMIGISNRNDILDDFSRANKFSSRAKWSNSSTIGMNIISKILLDENLKNDYLKEIHEASDMLKKRATLFKELAKKYDLDLLNYKSGFFLTIKTSDPWKVYEELTKEKIHIVPMTNSIRVTISSITLAEIERMVEKMALVVKKYQ